MEMRKEELDTKQDELAEELCALLGKAGKGGASSRVFEIPEYARRRIDVSPSKGKITGHFKDLVISDWKRKDHEPGQAPEPRISGNDLLLGIAVFLQKHGLSVYRDDRGMLYLIGLERYNGLPVEGIESGHLYRLYVAEESSDAYTVSADGAPIRGRTARCSGEKILLKGWFRKRELRPLTVSESEYLQTMRAKAKGGK